MQINCATHLITQEVELGCTGVKPGVKVGEIAKLGSQNFKNMRLKCTTDHRSDCIGRKNATKKPFMAAFGETNSFSN